MIRSDNARGVGFMATAMFAFTINDAMMKKVTETLPLMQAILLRGILTVAAVLILARLTGQLRLALPRQDRRLVLIRSAAEVGATITFLGALMYMPLANLSAIMQSLPLAVTLAAALVLGEKVGWRRLSAIGAGFLGVLLIVRPGTAGFDIWSVVGVASVACVVVRDLCTRAMSPAVSSMVVAVYTAGSVGLLGAVGLAVQGVWQPVPLVEAGRLVLASGAAVMGYLYIVKAMRVGDVALVAPFRYTALVWAILLGWALWGTWPDAPTWAGAALIVASGLFTLWREARLKAQGR